MEKQRLNMKNLKRSAPAIIFAQVMIVLGMCLPGNRVMAQTKLITGKVVDSATRQALQGASAVFYNHQFSVGQPTSLSSIGS